MVHTLVVYCIELKSVTGLALTPDDLEKCMVRRAGGDTAIIEVPEVIYTPALKKCFLFVSYSPLFTTYNVRVGRADNPEGPYLDINGKDMSTVEDNFPVLTYAYRLDNQLFCSGIGCCGVLNDNGIFYIFHQGRLAPDNFMMDLHVRKYSDFQLVDR